MYAYDGMHVCKAPCPASRYHQQCPWGAPLKAHGSTQGTAHNVHKPGGRGCGPQSRSIALPVGSSGPTALGLDSGFCCPKHISVSPSAPPHLACPPHHLWS